MDAGSVVAERIADVEATLINIGEQKKLVENGNSQVQAQIREKFLLLAEMLQGRERQLLRQVDVITHHQMSLLQTRHANALQTLGSLQSSSQSLQHCADKNAVHIAEFCRDAYVKPVPQLQVCVDTCVLEKAIQHVGEVKMEGGGLLSLQDSHAAYCMPYRMEDYTEDGQDNLWMYKSLHQSSPICIKVSFPQPHLPLPRNLANPKKSEDKISAKQDWMNEDASELSDDVALQKSEAQEKSIPESANDKLQIDVKSKTRKELFGPVTECDSMKKNLSRRSLVTCESRSVEDCRCRCDCLKKGEDPSVCLSSSRCFTCDACALCSCCSEGLKT